ncbi:MAG: M23 family metallopeptidase [Micromonosporaceae bacterium]|nr:M23 family metallopeptidase [Micromonosporaceae bacterium]
MVALGAQAALPDHADPLGSGDAAASADLVNRLLAEDRASRDDSRDGAVASEQKAPDVWLLPVQTYHVTSLYGTRWGRLHAGVDLAATEGTPMYAAAAGLVTLCRWSSGYGYTVQITHGGGITTIYGHASKLLCEEGQRVQAGDLIAKVGNTGHSFGSHLHYEIRLNGKAIEPTGFMKAHGVDIIKHAQAVYGDIISD